jgi:hypothetical protein
MSTFLDRLDEQTKKDLIEAVEARTLIPFVGTGVSKRTLKEISTWLELIKKLLDAAKSEVEKGKLSEREYARMLPYWGEGSYLTLAEILRYRLPQTIYLEVLNKTYDVNASQPDELYGELFRLRAPYILTTNYDRLLENAYAKQYGEVPTVFTYKEAEAMRPIYEARRGKGELPEHEGENTFIFKLLGSIDRPTELIMTEIEYRRAMVGESKDPTLLADIFATQNVLLIGFSEDDLELSVVLDNMSKFLQLHSTTPDWILLPEEAPAAAPATETQEQKATGQNVGLASWFRRKSRKEESGATVQNAAAPQAERKEHEATLTFGQLRLEKISYRKRIPFSKTGQPKDEMLEFIRALADYAPKPPTSPASPPKI